MGGEPPYEGILYLKQHTDTEIPSVSVLFRFGFANGCRRNHLTSAYSLGFRIEKSAVIRIAQAKKSVQVIRSADFAGHEENLYKSAQIL